ncbi:MAG: hypothetical protein WKF43_12060 [Acidimicrobiales bacterium]
MKGADRGGVGAGVAWYQGSQGSEPSGATTSALAKGAAEARSWVA